MNRYMIDIETLSVDTRNALILSVACAEFSFSPNRFSILNPEYWVMDIREQLALGRKVDHGTQAWWAQQDPAAIEAWSRPSSTYTAAELFDHLHGKILSGDECEVWANGVVFDIGNLEGLAQQIKKKIVPWKYNQVRDARTAYRLPRIHSRQVPTDWQEPDYPNHHPVGDCIRQVIQLWQHWPHVDVEEAPEIGRLVPRTMP
jgi:hypothetical protein